MFCPYPPLSGNSRPMHRAEEAKEPCRLGTGVPDPAFTLTCPREHPNNKATHDVSCKLSHTVALSQRLPTAPLGCSAQGAWGMGSATGRAG
jgi:hypothetical protein